MPLSLGLGLRRGSRPLLPPPPAGFAYLADIDGALLRDSDGALLTTPV